MVVVLKSCSSSSIGSEKEANKSNKGNQEMFVILIVCTQEDEREDEMARQKLACFLAEAEK